MAIRWPGTRARELAASADTRARELDELAAHLRLSAAADARVSARLVELIATQRTATVSRSVAMTVPAFARGLQLITGTVAGFGLMEYGPDGAVVPRQLLTQPNPRETAFATIRQLADDLTCYGTGWWQVLTVSGDSGYTYPTAVHPVPASSVTVDTADTWPDGSPKYARVDNTRYRLTDPTTPGCLPGDLVMFTAGSAALTHGASTLQLAAALEATVAAYAATPLPQVALKNAGADLPDTQVQSLLDDWETARASRVTAYLSSAVDIEKLSWSSAELQLVDARNQAALEVSRLLGLDPVWVGIGVPGSSLTYTNRQDLYRQLVDLTLRPLLAAVEQRLSMWDLTPRGHTVRFDLTAFLRGNPDQRAQLVTQLVPLGVMTVEEARQLMEYAPTGNVVTR